MYTFIYEEKIQNKTFSRIYKCIDIKYNTILLKNKDFQKLNI